MRFQKPCRFGKKIKNISDKISLHIHNTFFFVYKPERKLAISIPLLLISNRFDVNRKIEGGELGLMFPKL